MNWHHDFYRDSPKNLNPQRWKVFLYWTARIRLTFTQLMEKGENGHKRL